jgi:hypothetical protein
MDRRIFFAGLDRKVRDHSACRCGTPRACCAEEQGRSDELADALSARPSTSSGRREPGALRAALDGAIRAP